MVRRVRFPSWADENVTQNGAVPQQGRKFPRKPILYAVSGFLAAAYFFFLITHVPEAGGANGPWRIDETEALRVVGPTTGQFLTMTVRGEGLASVSAGPGSRLSQPDKSSIELLETMEPQFKPPPPGSRVDLRIDNNQEDFAAVSVQLDSPGGQSVAEIQPDTGGDETGLRLQASGASMTVAVDWSSPKQSSEQKGPLLVGIGGKTLPVGRAVISVPAGQMLYIGGPPAKTVFEIGSHRDRLSVGGLDARGLEIAGQQNGPVTSRACGARSPAKLGWPGPFGGFGLNACLPTLHVQDLKLGDQSVVALSGSAFLMANGDVHYWTLLPSLMSNLVIQLALTTLVGGFISWVSFNLGHKRAEDPSLPAKRPARRRAPH